jgi:Zn-dependent protease with chaperone function
VPSGAAAATLTSGVNQDAQTFVGSACHPAAAGEAVEGRIAFNRCHLQFLSPALSFEIPLAKLELEVDQTAGGRVCFYDPDRPKEVVYTFDLQILEHSALRQHAHTRAQIGNLRAYAELKRRIKLTVGFLAGFALLAVLVSWALGVMVRSLAAHVPPEFERQLGEEAMADLRQEHTFVQDPKLMARLTNAVAPVIAAVADQTRHYRFYIMQEEQPNAFALPGGQVVVTTGLLDLAQGPDELAAVVAHEIAHLTQHHLFRKIISSAGPFLVFRLFVGGKGGLLSVLGAGSQLLIAQSFSQEYELEADAVGWDYLVAAHIDPRAAIVMLRKVRSVEQHEPADLEPQAFSSHPATDKRIRRLEARWRQFKGKSSFEPAAKPE